METKIDLGTRDLEKDLIEIEGAIKSQTEQDNMFTVAVLQRCHKLVSELMKYRNMVKLTMGDWSGDGHENCDTYLYIVNYPVEKLRQAYKDSCAKLNIQFNHNETYTENGEHIWTEYEDSHMPADIVNRLKEHDIITQEMIDNADYDVDDENPENYYFDIDTAAEIIMRFISYSMPDDFEYKSSSMPETDPINGYWNKELNVTFGYGLYS